MSPTQAVEPGEVPVHGHELAAGFHRDRREIGIGHEVAGHRVLAAKKIEDLPVPEPRPTMLVMPVLGMEMESWSTALTAPKCLEISEVSRTKSSAWVAVIACTSQPGPAA